MRLIFIRHAEPDYDIDGLTEKGSREAHLLADRIASWDRIDGVYVSPLGRAQLTAKIGLSKLREEQLTDRFRAEQTAFMQDKENGFPAETKDWLQEFAYRVNDPTTGRYQCPWDFMPEFYTNVPEIYDRGREDWMTVPPYTQNPEIPVKYREVGDGINEVLAHHGYRRQGGLYVCDPEKTDGDEEQNVLFFCHFGVICMILSHITGIPAPLLTMETVIPPSGVTVLLAEKRMHDFAHFRMQLLGCTKHLSEHGERVSDYAAFAPVFQR